jgi:hypothetical protein
MEWWMPNDRNPTPRGWQSRQEILRDYLDSLSPDELLRERPHEYWLRYGSYARKYDPNQPRDRRGRWADAGAGIATNSALESFSAARRRGGSMAYCMAQYAVDGLLCNSTKSASRAAACWKQAAERLGNCLAGRPIPPLNF